MSDLSASAVATAAAFLAFCFCFVAFLAAASACHCSSSARSCSAAVVADISESVKLCIFLQAQQLHQAHRELLYNITCFCSGGLKQIYVVVVCVWILWYTRLIVLDCRYLYLFDLAENSPACKQTGVPPDLFGTCYPAPWHEDLREVNSTRCIGVNCCSSC